MWECVPPRHDGKLHVPGNDRGDGRALHAHFRRAEFAEDQDVIQHQIHEHRRNAAQHGDESLPGLPEGAGIGVGQGEGQKAPEHDGQIFKAVIQRPGGSGGVALAGEVKSNQTGTAQQENGRAHQRDDDTDQELKPEGVADALVILGAVELGGEDTRAGACAEDAQVEYEQQAVDEWETPLMGTVPTCPTMMLSSRDTKLVMPFWMIMGTATPKTRR